jgi:hypothetical protein
MACNEGSNAVLDCGPCSINLGEPGQRVIPLHWGGQSTNAPNYRLFPSREITEKSPLLKGLAAERMGVMGANERALNFNRPPRRGDAIRDVGHFQNQNALAQFMDCLDGDLVVGDKLDIIAIAPETHWTYTYWGVTAPAPGLMLRVVTKFGGIEIGVIDAGVVGCGVFAPIPGSAMVPATPGDPAANPPIPPTAAVPAVAEGHYGCANEVVQVEITSVANAGGVKNAAFMVSAAVLCPHTGK